MIYTYSSRKVEPPVPLNRDEIRALLQSSYPDALKRRGVGGAVLVRVDIGHRGNVVRARAIPPKWFGRIPRPKPIVCSPSTGRRLHFLKWASDPGLLQLAERAAQNARFIPAGPAGVGMPWKGYPYVLYFAPDLPFDPRRKVDIATGVLTTIR